MILCRSTFAIVVSVCALVGATACSGTPRNAPTAATPLAGSDPGADTAPAPTSPTPAPGVGSASIVVVGDVGWCGSEAVTKTAALVDRIAGDLLLPGDIAYPHGTPEDFTRCFEPHYGRFRSRFRPVPGNHEYDRGGDGYFGYFGEAAGPSRLGYYAYRAGSWRMLMLNSAVSIQRGSPQYEWVRQELQQAPALCTLVAMHHPFESSGDHGATPAVRDVWQLIHEAGVDVVVNGHDHLYERFAEQNADRRAEPGRGVRQFTVGTGGAPLYPRSRYAPNSEVVLSTWGVLSMRLEPAHYEWSFVDVGGNVLDSGTTACH